MISVDETSVRKTLLIAKLWKLTECRWLILDANVILSEELLIKTENRIAYRRCFVYCLQISAILKYTLHLWNMN